MYQALINRTDVPKGNKPILYSILILSTIVIFSTISIAHGESLEVSTDKPEYDHNTVIFLHGFVSDPIKNVDVKIEVINPTFWSELSKPFREFLNEIAQPKNKAINTKIRERL